MKTCEYCNKDYFGDKGSGNSSNITEGCKACAPEINTAKEGETVTKSKNLICTDCHNNMDYTDGS